MANGIVKCFFVPKGYGFITEENGEDIFVHYSAICGEGYRVLHKNQKVTFDIGYDKSGHKMATNVCVNKNDD